MKCTRTGTVPEHEHETVLEAKICHGLVAHPALAPVVPTSPARPARVATAAQIKYATDLGGDPARIAQSDFYSLSSYIDELKRNGATVQRAPVIDPKLEFAKEMLTSVPDGYYAVRPMSGATFFMRVSRPKNGQYKNCLKIQSLHGTGGSNLPSRMEALVLWPSAKYTFFGRYQQDHWRETLVDSILLLVTDTRGAQRRYAEEIGRCCRCNASLTDERSRHYGIGPECEKYAPQIIEMVDAEDALKGS